MSSVITSPYMTSVITYCFTFAFPLAPNNVKPVTKMEQGPKGNKKLEKKPNTFPLQFFQENYSITQAILK